MANKYFQEFGALCFGSMMLSGNMNKAKLENSLDSVHDLSRSAERAAFRQRG